MLEFQKKSIRLIEALENQGYQYSLHSYVSGLSELAVRVYKPDCPDRCIRITFQTTRYIKMPSDWAHGDFCLATPEQHKKLITELGLSESQARQMLLFTAQPPKKPEILVLCMKVFVSEETLIG